MSGNNSDIIEVHEGDWGRQEWASKARRLIKRELKYNEITYEELARRLQDMGIKENAHSIAMKIGRGMYPTWFFLAAMRAIGCRHMKFEDL